MITPGKRRGAKVNPHTKSRSTPSKFTGKPKQTPTQQKQSNWFQDFCSNADGAGVIAGLAAVGPVAGFSDLLLAGQSPSPQAALAAEQIVHLIDGWRYASSAVAAYLNHAEGAATHFAYYAELRAAMSLFAWSGMHINQSGHYYLDRGGARVDVSPMRTHTAVWGVWQQWILRPDARSLFYDKLRLLPAVSIGTVLSALQYSLPNQIFQGWGFDLLDISKDHHARNHSSYEPYWATTPLTRMTAQDVDLVRSLWSLFLSDGTNLVFDGALASYFVEQVLPTMTKLPHSVDAQRQKIAAEVSKKTGVSAADIERRLTPTSYDFTAISLASSNAVGTKNILCRAFFLLRMAMLALKGNLAMTSNTSAKKWLENWLDHAGIWSPTLGIDLADVEEDYRLALLGLDSSSVSLPDIKLGENLQCSAILSRPDACIAWGVVA